MADIFISYARTDKNFVHDVQQALSARGRETWVDWRDIPPTAEWLQEIYAGIEAANAVVFVLSPDFVASKICSLEVNHAIACKKRLIPVVRLDVSPEQVNPGLSALNWIFFREGDQFEAALATLLTALDTDLEYDRASTRLLMRAREWETRNRVDAAALRGVELEEAERWLARGTNNIPSPSTLQVEYITASRKAAERRQRRLLIGVSAALVVTLALSVVSLALYQVAQARERVAQTNFAHALSRQSAAESRNHDSDQPDLAMLLAVEAYHRDPSSAEAADALLTSLEAQPQLAGFVQNYTNTWASVAFSPDGKELAAGSSNGVITFWDVATRHPIGSPIVADSLDHGPVLVAFSPDGRLLGSTGPQMTLQVWDVRSHHFIAASRQLGTTGTFGGIAFSPNSKQLAVNACITSPNSNYGNTPSVGIWNLTSGDAANALPVAASSGCSANGGGVAFSSDGSLVAAGVYGGADIWNATTGIQLKGLLPATTTPTQVGVISDEVDTVAFSPHGSLLAVGQCGKPASHAQSESYCQQGAIQLWNVVTGQLVATLKGHTTDVTGLAFSPDGSVLASASGDNSIILWDLSRDKKLYTFDAHLAVTNRLVAHQIAFSPNGGLLASASDSDLNVSLWNMTNPQPLAALLPAFADQPPPVPPFSEGEIDDVAFSPNNSMLAAIGCTSLSTSDTLPSAASNTPNLAVVWLWNPTTHQPIGELRMNPNTCGQKIAFSPDSQKLASVINTYGVDANGNFTATTDVRLWETTTHRFLGQPWPAPVGQGIDALTFSPSGSLLVEGGCGTLDTVAPQNMTGEIVLRNLATGQTNQLAWKGHSGCVQALAISPDGKMLAAGVCLDKGLYPCLESELQFWNLVNKRPIGQPISVNFGDFVHLRFSPDGRSLAAEAQIGQAAGGTVFWDVASHRQTQTLPPTDGAAISDNWSLMASSSCSSFLSISNQCNGYDTDTIQLSDLQQDQNIGVPLAAPSSGATQLLLFGPDNKTLVSWSLLGGSLLIWNLNPASWATQICAVVGRNLTRDEWNRYLTTQEPYSPTCPAMPLAPTT